MIDLCNTLVDNGLTREEILPKIEVVSTSFEDAPKITELLAKCFALYNQEEALRQLIYSDARLDKSVKAIDRETGEIYGFLIFCNFPLHVGSPIFHINPRLGGFLAQFKQLNGHSFIIDERLRGTGIDKKMLMFQKDFLDEYEMVWAAVERDLKSHNYWKRLGFKEVFSIHEASFYAIFNEKMDIEYIYSIIDKFKNEENHYKRGKRTSSLRRSDA
jgi:hypothetical protein